MSEFSALILGVSFLFGCLALAKAIERAVPKNFNIIHTTKFVKGQLEGVNVTMGDGTKFTMKP